MADQMGDWITTRELGSKMADLPLGEPRITYSDDGLEVRYEWATRRMVTWRDYDRHPADPDLWTPRGAGWRVHERHRPAPGEGPLATSRGELPVSQGGGHEVDSTPREVGALVRELRRRVQDQER